MLKTQKFNSKNITDSAVKLVSVVSGTMLGGALENVLPESASPYADAGLAIAGGATATMLKDKSTTGMVLKYTSLGVASRSLFNLISEQFQKSVPQIEEGQEIGLAQKLVRGAVGMASPKAVDYLASPATPTIDFDRYEVVETNQEAESMSDASHLLG